ncbi:hypothetical protein [Bremerella cremea]|uniref:hypothetical protein n=1 Tax=Bremerella cremea TaxID=1031537 RepID=UPI0031F0E043
MKKFAIGVCVSSLLAAFGCSSDSSTTPPTKATTTASKPTNPPATTTKKPVLGTTENTFRLSVPYESISLTQGEKQSILIGIDRGTNFREEVSIEVSDLPKGVTLETSSPVIRHGEKDVSLVLQAQKDAALGDFTFHIKGHTESSGADFEKEVTMSVAQN